jgi:hypothetical protein
MKMEFLFVAQQLDNQAEIKIIYKRSNHNESTIKTQHGTWSYFSNNFKY